MSETIFEKERQKQETNEELDAFLASVQQELMDLKHRLAQLRQKRKAKKPKPAGKPEPFDIKKVEDAIKEIRAVIVLEGETDSLLKTHPPEAEHSTPGDKPGSEPQTDKKR